MRQEPDFNAVMQALGEAVWRYGELTFTLSLAVWLLMADSPTGNTFGPHATADMDFVKLVRAMDRLGHARELPQDLQRRLERVAKRLLRLNTRRVELLHAWFGMAYTDEGGQPVPRIIRVLSSPGALKAHIQTPNPAELAKLASDLGDAQEELKALIHEAARELGIVPRQSL